MVFSSVPAYLDAHNWQQQSSQQEVGSHNIGSLPPPVPPPPPVAAGAGVGGTGGVGKPGSMSERARLAKVPQPETALKCPRCDSTNTKFCYFNNYSLSQPRHFCKTCRRYWTRGGALRNVPVGGGCRRNKRGKARSRSKSPVSAPATSHDAIGQLISPTPQLPFLPSLPHLSNYGTTADTGFVFTAGTDLSMAVTSGHSLDGMEFPTISSGGGGGGDGGGSSVLSAWRLQQSQHFPFLAGLDPPPSGAYPLHGDVVTTPPGYFRVPTGQLGSKPLVDGFVKDEETQQGLNLPNDFSGANNDNQYWPGSSNAWADLSGFTSSSTSHLL